MLVAKSGVEIVAGEYETVVPSELAASPAPVKAGNVLTISGKDLSLVNAIDLPGAAGVEFESAETIKLTMPEIATEGEATLIMENGKAASVAFTLVKPVFKAFSENPAAFSKLTGEICNIFNDVLGITPDHIYVKYQAVSNWGWNGGNF